MPFLEAIAPAAISAAATMFGGGGRVSHEHFMEGEARADISNQRQIGRSGSYLEGLVPSQVNAVKGMASGLGMSPWEIMANGQGGSPQVMSAGAPDSGQAEKYMAQAIPLQIAKMNQQTQLATTAMQTDTQRYMADQSTNKGALPKQNTLQSYAQTLQTVASTKLTETQEDAARNKIFLDALQGVYNMLPTETVDLGLYQDSAKKGWDKLTKLIPDLPAFASQPGGDQRLANAVRSMNSGEFQELRNTAIQLGSLISKATSGASSLLSQGSKFLKGIGTKTTKAGPIGSKETQSIIDGLTKSGR